MANVFFGRLNAKGKKFALVVSRFNEFISSKLVDGAQDTLLKHNADQDNIDVYWVPGSFEIPTVVEKLTNSKKYDAIICLGAIIRGETPHFDYIAGNVSREISKLSLQKDIPIAFGIITADTVEQAIDRAGTKFGNKGNQAALSAIEMLDLFNKISKK